MQTKKVSIIGMSGVGKTTLIKMLTDQAIPVDHNPTIALDFQKINLNNNNDISLWELGGQKQFQFMWDDFIKGSSVVCVVSDSTQENLIETKKIIEKYKHLKNKMVLIANKQDQTRALSPTEIKEKLGIETIEMIAIDKSKKRNLLRILEEKMKNL